MTGCLGAMGTEREKREPRASSKRFTRCQATPNRRAMLYFFVLVAGNCKSPLAFRPAFLHSAFVVRVPPCSTSELRNGKRTPSGVGANFPVSWSMRIGREFVSTKWNGQAEGRRDASNVVGCVSELKACRPSWVLIEPTQVAIFRPGIWRSLPPLLPWLHELRIKPKPLPVHIKVAGSGHVLALEMQWNGARGALLFVPVYERRSTAWAMVERRSFGCHGLSPGRS